jgi:hypothetical protein
MISTRNRKLQFDKWRDIQVDKQGIIRAAKVSADYTIRTEASETVEHLWRLTK